METYSEVEVINYLRNVLHKLEKGESMILKEIDDDLYTYMITDYKHRPIPTDDCIIWNVKGDFLYARDELYKEELTLYESVDGITIYTTKKEAFLVLARGEE